MTDDRTDLWAVRFDDNRSHLQALAYRMLGSLSEAEDAVQEAWLRFSRSDTSDVENLAAWLTRVVARVCLDMLRSRASRREDLVGLQVPEDARQRAHSDDPEQETLLVDSVGRALLIVLDRLGPDERVAFVLHEMFAVPFEDIGTILGRSSVTARKLASRARQRVRGTSHSGDAELAQHRQVVEAFLAASRDGDLDAVLAVLAPDVVRRADRSALAEGRATEIHGAGAVAEEIVSFGQNARFAELAVVNGGVGMVIAPRGHLQMAVTVTIESDKINGYELIADPARLRRLDIAVLDK